MNELKKHVDALKQLLDDPEPGLSSWARAYAMEMFWISNYWNGGLVFANQEQQRKLREL